MWIKEIYNCWKHALIFVSLATSSLAIVLLTQRGLHGEYSFGIHGFSVLFVGVFPFLVMSCVCSTRSSRLSRFAVAVFISTFLVLCYLSSNGLWCAQHHKVTQEMCAKLLQFASFTASANMTSWWLTLGDLLAIQRGRTMPMPWEHDIDVCISLKQFSLFEKALRSRKGYFHPSAERLEHGHWYLPIDMRELGLRARDAEGVNVDIWMCPEPSNGNITQVLYCGGFVNVPGSWEDRHLLLTEEYGDYSVVKYDHHASMCRIWNRG